MGELQLFADWWPPGTTMWHRQSKVGCYSLLWLMLSLWSNELMRLDFLPWWYCLHQGCHWHHCRQLLRWSGQHSPEWCVKWGYVLILHGVSTGWLCQYWAHCWSSYAWIWRHCCMISQYHRLPWSWWWHHTVWNLNVRRRWPRKHNNLVGWVLLLGQAWHNTDLCWRVRVWC